MEANNKGKVWIPIAMAGCIVVGLIVGNLMSQRSLIGSGNGLYMNKVNALMSLIDTKYVDSVDQKQMVEDLLPKILGELDPHSVYISAEDRAAANEQIEGSFSGIGVQFNIYDDTIRVVSVVSGGPSAKAGLLAGDKIIKINGRSFVGKSITTDSIMKVLRGQKGTKVRVTLLRSHKRKIYTYTIVRDDIPLYSVDAKYKIGKEIGYIKIGNFGRLAHSEFLQAMAYLQKHKCTKFIIDLRGNPGGLMEPALNIANEFLPANRLILYTKGKAYPREDVYSNGKGSFQQVPVAILVDEWSASSSEILAGAIQDNDRGYVVGRRSFGKGLVQNEIPFRDGSAVRLTIARFYIPSGRCIQKPYKNGEDENYQMDIVNRYMKGEFDSKANIHVNNKLRFKTVGGRIVYGGGGIIPDFFIPLDTTGMTSWYNKVASAGLIYGFAYSYTDVNRDSLKPYNTPNKLSFYLDDQDLISKFLEYAENRNYRGRLEFIEKSFPMALTQIKAYIARDMLDEDAFWKILQEDDLTLTKAVEIITKSKNATVLDDHF
ncbi:MAG: S41 family peptidase [Bacteroidales bacterium]|nr:S41 family peptidase [Bacteroidales bacterium]